MEARPRDAFVSWAASRNATTAAPTLSAGAEAEGPTTSAAAVSANVQGIAENSAEDMRAFRSNVILQAVAVVPICLLFFCVCRQHFPLVFEGEAAEGVLPPSFFGWVMPSLEMSVPDIILEAGLDRGLFIQFLVFATRVMAAIGGPLILILCPLHYFFGGEAAGQDRLSMFDMANVSPGSWICWVHAAAVWYVVLTLEYLVFSQKRPFVDARRKWLTEMPAPRSTTVMVEGIPEGLNTNDGLRQYFDEEVFGKPVVANAFVVKDTSELIKAMAKLQTANELLLAAKGKRQDVVLNAIGGSEPALLAQQIALRQQVDVLRKEIDESDEYNMKRGFVTFKRRRDAGIVMRLFAGSASEEEISVSLPPAASDILWEDMITKVSPEVQTVRETTGYLLVFGIFVLFVPIVLWIAAIARWESLHATFGNLSFDQDPFAQAARNYPEQVALWNGLVGTVVLVIVMGFIPTLLMLVFANFFVLKSKAAQQSKVQIWYFYFLVIFVLLVTAIGSSDFGLLQTVTFLVRNPIEIFPRLAEKMPSSTHFYMNYLVVQWGVQAFNITRAWNLMKYLTFRQVLDAEEAKEWSEPEDQDFYGIGSLSARATLNLVIPLVFCTLSPFISLVGIVNFLIARLVHAYLFVFAETKKADAGGDFFYESLVEVQQGLFLYIILMTGVLMEKAASWVPGAISAASFAWHLSSYFTFRREFQLREMGLHELQDDATDAPGLRIYTDDTAGLAPGSQDSLGLGLELGRPRETYKQPELPAPPLQPSASVGGGWPSWLGGGAAATAPPLGRASRTGRGSAGRISVPTAKAPAGPGPGKTGKPGLGKRGGTSAQAFCC